MYNPAWISMLPQYLVDPARAFSLKGFQKHAVPVFTKDAEAVGHVLISDLQRCAADWFWLYVRRGYAMALVLRSDWHKVRKGLEEFGTESRIGEVFHARSRKALCVKCGIQTFTYLPVSENECVACVSCEPINRTWYRSPLPAIRRRMREQLAPGSHSRAEWLTLIQAQGRKCLRCGQSAQLTKDHVVPLAGGGTNDIGNIQGLCRSCNSWKGARHMDFRSCPSPRPAGAPDAEQRTRADAQTSGEHLT
jgi:hypothetical protein